jgi:hypothetical protein
VSILFDPPTVKELRNEAKIIGQLYGSAHLGRISMSDRDDVVQNRDIRERLQRAYAGAVRDVGEKKALKAALREANMWAEAGAQLGPGRYGHVPKEAEEAVRRMLSR